MVSGPWDFLGVLFAASGFLCLGGPVVLTGLQERMRRFWLMGINDGGLVDSDRQYMLWILLFGLYFFIVVVGVGILLLRRRAVTAIYNVDHEVFGAVLGTVLAENGIGYKQVDNVLYLQGPETESPFSGSPDKLEVEPSPRMRHITLSWSPARSRLRQVIETSLEKELEEVDAPHNPAGDWLLVISGLLFLALLLGLAVFALFWIFQRG